MERELIFTRTQDGIFVAQWQVRLVEDSLRKDIPVVPEGIFEAPQFMLQRGSELGYHCHVYRTLGRRDMGLMTTMVGEDVYVEAHRKGKIKKPCDIDQIGKRAIKDLIWETTHHLGSVPEESRRKPGKNAIVLGSQNDQTRG